MEHMKQLQRLTLELFETVDQATKAKERETAITKVTELLDQREALLQEMKEPFTAEELAIGKELLPMEEKIQQRMQLLFNDLKMDMRAVKKQKSTNQKYRNPYKDLANFDGTFLDKKK